MDVINGLKLYATSMGKYAWTLATVLYFVCLAGGAGIGYLIDYLGKSLGLWPWPVLLLAIVLRVSWVVFSKSIHVGIWRVFFQSASNGMVICFFGLLLPLVVALFSPTEAALLTTLILGISVLSIRVLTRLLKS
jgi:hypothetical protein